MFRVDVVRNANKQCKFLAFIEFKAFQVGEGKIHLNDPNRRYNIPSVKIIGDTSQEYGIWKNLKQNKFRLFIWSMKLLRGLIVYVEEN